MSRKVIQIAMTASRGGWGAGSTWSGRSWPSGKRAACRSDGTVLYPEPVLSDATRGGWRRIADQYGVPTMVDQPG